MTDINEKLQKRFWDKVEIGTVEECWFWQGTKNTYSSNKKPYGSFCGLKSRREQAHRMAYRLVCGKVSNDILIRHTCDNTLCCNPRHLLEGNHQDNMNDRQERGRQARGERHGSAKLTPDKVRDIRVRALAGEPQNNIAFDYKITPMTVSNIKTGHTWGHVQ